MRTIPTMRRERKEAAMKDRGHSCSTPRVHKDQWIREMSTNRRRRHAKNMKKEQAATAESGNALIFIHNNKSDKGPTSSLKVTKRTRIDLIHLGGGIMFPRQCIFPLHLRHPGGKSQIAGGCGTEQLHHGVNSDFSSSR